ncbi:hypothetical protein Cgig2_029944 [Carnegiea gigantea]|uniref:RNase H type-1 domain-containing protein n=1 Tax=Carnegiea gigantea TaxID=171969 RepID=A0A9Q1GZZ2_9CARY|nr:hypothetical protein Cgig2_029944 [Carnegiea gigantea]
MTICLELQRPPRIKLFGWRASIGSLPAAPHISSRVPDFSMTCSVCTHTEDTTTHAILECPLAVQLWGGSGLDTALWSTRHRTLADCVAKARETLDKDSFGDFLAVMWECWNARNRFIFRRPDNNLSVLGKRVIAFVRSFHELQNVELSPHTTPHPNYWSPPMTGIVADNTVGWGFILHDHDAKMLLTIVKHHRGYAGAPAEEARACLYGLLCAHAYGIHNIIVESDCLELIQMLENKSIYDNCISLFARDIISFVQNFDFYSWSFVKRGQ